MPITILTNELKVKNNNDYMSINSISDLIAESPLSKVELFDTVASMKADYSLHPGMYAQTAGYYSVNDNGGALYRITNSQPSSYYETLNNNLYAELIITTIMTPIQFGVKGDGITNDTVKLQAAVTYPDILDCLGLSYLVHPTEQLIENDTYMGINIHKSIKIKDGYFKMDADVERGCCVFTVDTNGGIVEFESVTIDGNVDNQSIVTSDGANHGIAISRLGTPGIVKLNNCTIKKCRTDCIMHRCGFLELKNCTIINNYRNGITCDRDAHISHCIFDSSGARTNPKTSIYHEPNEHYGFKNIRITVEYCGFNGYNWDNSDTDDTGDEEQAIEPMVPNGGIVLFAADTYSEIRRFIVQNCYSTNEYRWKCSIIASDGQIYDAIIKNNTDVKLICGRRPYDEHPASFIDTLVIDNNQRSTYAIGTTASNGPINKVRLSNFDTASLKCLIHCVIGELIIENGDFNGWADGDENKTNLIRIYSALYTPKKMIVKNCHFKNGNGGIYTYTSNNNPIAEEYKGEVAYVEDCTFINISSYACIRIFFKKIYLRNLYSENCSSYFIATNNNNHILMASDCIFNQTEANSFYNCQNVHALNCIYSYVIPS